MDFQIEHLFYEYGLQDVFSIIKKYVDFLNLEKKLTYSRPMLHDCTVSITELGDWRVIYDNMKINMILKLLASKLESMDTSYGESIIQPQNHEYNRITLMIRNNPTRIIVYSLERWGNTQNIVIWEPSGFSKSFYPKNISVDKKMLTLTLDNFTEFM